MAAGAASGMLMAMAAIQLKPYSEHADDPHALLPCEIYQAWQVAFDDAEEAFLAWCDAPGTSRPEAYAVYRAAADREDVAADCWLAV
jgi:hypothetical protein